MAAPRVSGAPASSSSGKIVIVGASGKVGCATIKALTRERGCSNIIVCSRNPRSSCASEHCTAGCRCVHGDYNDVESLKPNFAGASAVFLITPGAENRAELVQNGLNAAKAAGVPFVLVVSVMTADNTRTVYGAQFHEIERATKACGIPYALLRLPLFTDNMKMTFDEVREKGKLSAPLNPAAVYTSVATWDVGEAAAHILANPAGHHNKTYNIVGPAWCKNDAVAALSTALGRRVEYNQISYDEAHRTFRDKGMPEWQVRGMLELYHMIDDGRYNFKESDFKKLVGREPTTAQRWIEHHREEIVSGKHVEGGRGDGGRAGVSGRSGEIDASGKHSLMSGGAHGGLPGVTAGGTSGMSGGVHREIGTTSGGSSAGHTSGMGARGTTGGRT